MEEKIWKLPGFSMVRLFQNLTNHYDTFTYLNDIIYDRNTYCTYSAVSWRIKM